MALKSAQETSTRHIWGWKTFFKWDSYLNNFFYDRWFSHTILYMHKLSHTPRILSSRSLWLNETFESEASESAERKLQSSIIQGTSTKWRIYNIGQKVWKAFKFESSGRVIIVHLHIAVVKILRRTLIATSHRRCAKIILDKNSFSVPLLWLPWHFELNVWSWLLASFRVKDGKYLSVGFIFRISAATLMVFRG